MTIDAQWRIKGDLLGACNCDWGCPCNFDAPPTNGTCQGVYTWHIREGRFGDVVLDGLYISVASSTTIRANTPSLPPSTIADRSSHPRNSEKATQPFWVEDQEPVGSHVTAGRTFRGGCRGSFDKLSEEIGPRGRS